MAQVRPPSPRSARLVTAFAFLILYVPLISMVIYSFLGPSAGPGSPNRVDSGMVS